MNSPNNPFKPARAVFLSFAVMALLSGCSGQPSEGVGRQIMKDRIEKQSNGGISLVRFVKTNATGNDQYYQMEYEADILFLEDGVWTAGSDMASSPSFEFSPGHISQNGGPMQLLASVTGAKNVVSGQRVTVKGVLRFEKTERGWRGEDGIVY